MTFEMKPEMLSYDITDRVIQIYDMVLDYSGKYTAAEIMEQFENSIVEFDFEKGYGASPDAFTYVPDEWISPGLYGSATSTGKTLHLLPKHEEEFYIEVMCVNPTDEIIELKDTVVNRIVLHRTRSVSDRYESIPYPVYIWFPRGIRIDGNGLNYENLSEHFPEFEVIEVSDIYDSDMHKTDDGLYWHAYIMSYELRKHVDDAYRWDGTTSPLYAVYRFQIDSITKDVSAFTYDISDYYMGGGDSFDFGYNIKDQKD